MTKVFLIAPFLSLTILLGCGRSHGVKSTTAESRRIHEGAMVALGTVPLDSVCRQIRCAVLMLDSQLRTAPRLEAAVPGQAVALLALDPAEVSRAVRYAGPVVIGDFPPLGVDGDTIALAVVSVGPLAASPNEMSIMVYLDAMSLYGAVVLIDLHWSPTGWIVLRRRTREG